MPGYYNPRSFRMGETKMCGKCGSKNPVSNGFCEQCGSKLQASGPAEKPSKPSPATSRSSKPYNEEDPKEKSSTFSSRNGGFNLSWIELAYIALLLITVFTRFDHLGNKPHHHDESMHVFYSYQLLPIFFLQHIFHY